MIDISNPEWEDQAEIVDSLIRELGAEQTPCLRVFNKCDQYFGILPHGEDVVCISAKTGEGADILVQKLTDMLTGNRREAELLLPYSDAGLVDALKREAEILSLEYTEEGIRVKAVLEAELFGRVKQFIPGYTDPPEEWEK